MGKSKLQEMEVVAEDKRERTRKRQNGSEGKIERGRETRRIGSEEETEKERKTRHRERTELGDEERRKGGRGEQKRVKDKTRER